MIGDQSGRAQPVSDESLDQVVGGTLATPDSLNAIPDFGDALLLQQKLEQKAALEQMITSVQKQQASTGSSIAGNLK